MTPLLRRLVVACAVLTILVTVCPHAEATFTYLGSCKAQLGQDGGTTGACDTTGADLIVIGISWFGNTATPPTTFTDSKGNSYASAGLTAHEDGNPCSVRLYYLRNPVVGSGHTWTVSESSHYIGFTVAWFSGSNATLSIQQNGSTAAGAVTSLATGSVTPTNANALIVSALEASNADLLTEVATASGMTVVQANNQGSNSQPVALAYVIQSGGPSALNSTWAWTSASNSTSTIATFDTATGGGAVTPRSLLLGVGP